MHSVLKTYSAIPVARPIETSKQRKSDILPTACLLNHLVFQRIQNPHKNGAHDSGECQNLIRNSIQLPLLSDLHNGSLPRTHLLLDRNGFRCRATGLGTPNGGSHRSVTGDVICGRSNWTISRQAQPVFHSVDAVQNGKAPRRASTYGRSCPAARAHSGWILSDLRLDRPAVP